MFGILTMYDAQYNEDFDRHKGQLPDIRGNILSVDRLFTQKEVVKGRLQFALSER